MLVDSHCHLDFPDYAEDLEDVIARAGAAGVGCIVTISTLLSRAAEVRAIAHRFSSVYCTAGVHPHECAAEGVSEPGPILAEIVDPRVVGIGETGLDFHYERSPREAQIRSFRAHIAAARESGLPLVVHSRGADAETAEILAEEMGKGAFRGLIHCFSTSRQLAMSAIDLGLSISLSGILTFRNADALREIAHDLPLDRLLVETDAPFLAPVPKRGKRNEPAYVVHTAAKLAEVKGIEPAEVAKVTTGNFFRLFDRIPRPEAL